MTEVLVARAPRVRCYECGSDRIFSVCHHCQRPMCDQHSPLAFRQGSILVRMPTGAAEEARPASREFAGLRLGGMREAVYHCKDHAHLVRGGMMRWIAGGAGIAVLGLVLLFVAATVGLVFLLIGAAVTGIALLVERWTAAGTVRPPLPLLPQVDTVAVVERLTGYVRLEKGEYTSTVESVAGEVTVDLSANDGHTVLQAYRRKYQVPEFAPVPFSGGYLMIEGEAGLAFRAGQPSVLTGGTGISLGGESAADSDLFPVDPELPQRESTLVVDYEVQDGRSPREIPLWIVPSLVPASDRRTLEIDLHWNRLGPRRHRLSLAMLDLVELRVPVGWGNVESFAPGRVEVGRSADRRIIRWKQLRPDRPGASSLTLKLRFERPITEILESSGAGAGGDDPSDTDGDRTRLTLAGRLEATFNGLLSGVTGLGVYLPGGGPGHRPSTTTQTKVAVDFDVSLRAIRYQDERVVPDEKHPDDIASGRNRADEFAGVVPDYGTVAALTNAISADDYYVKSVVEHPPKDDYSTGVVKRVWDIAGRLYVGLFPIDFDINLRGDEVGTANGSGRTVAQVTVKGAYAVGTLVDSRDPADADHAGADGARPTVDTAEPGDELLKRIEDTWTSLHARVAQVLAGRAAGVRGVRAVTGSPESVVRGEVFEPILSDWSAAAPTADLVDAPGTDDPPLVGTVLAPPDGVAGQVAELRRRRIAADEAVIEGRISEETPPRHHRAD